MTPVRLEPAAPRSRVKHSTTEPMVFYEVLTASIMQGARYDPHQQIPQT